MTKRRSMASYKAGEKGRNRVRLLADPRTGLLQLEYRDEHGRKARTSTKTRNVATAKAMADELAARLARGETPQRHQAPTLATLFDNWNEDVGGTHSPVRRKQDQAVAHLLCRIIGPAVRADTLTPGAVRRFIAERRRLGHQGRPGAPIGNRTIQYAVKLLLSALRWAVREGMLERHPLEGFQAPSEPSPRRPVISTEEYQRLLNVAGEVHPLAGPLLVLTAETGHRVSAVLGLRWSDINPASRTATWRAEHDKLGREHVTPLTRTALQALDQLAATHVARGLAPSGEAYLFPYRNGAPVTRHLAGYWWKAMQHKAGLAPQRGRGWHTLRRRFATSLLDQPVKIIAELGGWRDVTTVARVYQQPDQEQLRAALERRA